MVMRTGTMSPSFAWACVAALNSLQKPMMLTPCWPSAGPTGGEGFAFPAGSCSLTSPVTFFAIVFDLLRGASGRPEVASHGELRLLHLHEIQLDGRGAAEDGNQDPNPALVGAHLFNRHV